MNSNQVRMMRKDAERMWIAGALQDEADMKARVEATIAKIQAGKRQMKSKILTENLVAEIHRAVRG